MSGPRLNEEKKKEILRLLNEWAAQESRAFMEGHIEHLAKQEEETSKKLKETSKNSEEGA